MRIFKILFVVAIFITNINSQTLINRYSEKLMLENDGNLKLDITFNLKSDSMHTLSLPLNFNNKDVKILNYDSTIQDIKLEKNDGVKFIVIYFKGFSDSLIDYNLKLEVKNYFDFEKNKTDFGNYILSYKFVNFSSLKIRKIESYIFLPEKFVFTSVLETLPKQKSNNPEDIYVFSRENSRNYIKLKNSDLGIGDGIFIKFKFKMEEKSKIFLVILVFIAVGYMIFFRDLVKQKKVK